MGAPTVYYYDDPGAPVLTSIQDAFYQILMACLVNGYGSKPAAGWSVVHDQWAAHGHASFTNNTESGVLGLVRNTTANFGPYLYIAEAMVDYQTAVNARSGMRSNITPSTLATASLTGRQRAHGARWERWVCVADEQGAWLFFSLDDDRLFSPWQSSHQSIYYRPIYVGAMNSFFGFGGRADAALGNFIVAGGCGDSNSSSEWHNVNANHPSTLFYDRAGAVAADGSLLALHPFCFSANQFLIGSAADGFTRFYLQPTLVVDATGSVSQQVVLGELAFIKTSWELSAAGTSATTRGNAQRIQPSGQTLRDPVLINGVPHLMAPMGYYAYALISLDAADWA